MTEAVKYLLNEMDRRFNLQSYEDDYLPNNDTQLGVEFAIEFVNEQVKKELEEQHKGYELSIKLNRNKILEEVEKSLPSDDDIKSEASFEVNLTNGQTETRFDFQVIDAVKNLRNKTQEAINKLKP